MKIKTEEPAQDQGSKGGYTFIQALRQNFKPQQARARGDFGSPENFIVQHEDLSFGFYKENGRDPFSASIFLYSHCSQRQLETKLFLPSL